jgi:hypothetical protein
MALTASEKQKLYRQHNLNKKSLENAIDLIKQNLKDCFRKEISENVFVINLSFTDKRRIKLIENIRSYNRILFGLLVSWSDESIRRLFYEPNVFTEGQIDYLLKSKALEQKWTLALKIAFLKAHGLIPTGNETCRGLVINAGTFSAISPDLLAKYDATKLLIENFLIPSFNIRNKVQHGEWIAAFKPPHSKEYSRALTNSIFRENIVTISSRVIIFNSVYQMIVDLARFSSNNFKIDPSTTPFQFFYELHIKKIEYEKNKIKIPNLNLYINELVVKKQNSKKYTAKVDPIQVQIHLNCLQKLIHFFATIRCPTWA